MIDDELREFIKRSGLSHRALGMASGVDTAIVSRFMSGQRDLRLATAARIVDALDLELAPRRKPRRKA